MAFDRWQRAVEETRELDLLPVMNLFMVLIPFLLMGAAFYHIGVIPTSLPTHTPQESDVPKTPVTVSVNLSLGPAEMSLSISSTSMTDEELAEHAAEWPAPGGAYPLDALVAHLKGLKANYPKSNTLIVLPHEALEYEKLVGVLDATRDYPTGEKRDGEDVRADLFPVVVFSRLIPLQAADEGSAGEAEAAADAPAVEEVAP